MKLYHGTSASRLDSILAHGLKPRARKRGNWSRYPSRKDMVYLTTAYAPYFGVSSLSDNDKTIAIIEVDADVLSEDCLYPDEDFIAQAIAWQKQCPIELVHQEVRDGLEGYRHHWKDSVNGLGNAAHRGAVSALAITRVCTVDLTRQKEMVLICDPCISALNYRFCGERYRSITAWLFGDRPDFLLGAGDNASYFQVMERLQPGFAAMAEKIFSNREGIEVKE